MRSSVVHNLGISLKSLVILLGLVVNIVTGRLQPAENIFPTDVNKALLPNYRQNLNDCHLRYHKYGDYNLVYPIFGVPVRIGEFAHMAAIGWVISGNVEFSCGGSLITPSHVLTGAHCGYRDGLTPTVVRLGVINVNVSIDDPSNKFAQQYEIASFKRHPEHKYSSFYHDIAIITLKSAAAINDVVTPACLWNQNSLAFPRLEAAGFGQTSFAGSQTPILLKVQLSPIDNTECRNHHPSDNRRLRQGIIDSQMCAQDSKMDTCLGDSGGPLQMKLMSNHRTTPFVVGITSFGSFCGTQTPSVYTRVSAYISWIEAETNTSFTSAECTARYVHLREADESMVSSRVGDHLFIEPEKSYMDIEIFPKHQAYLGYSAGKLIQWNCGGVLINEDYVLTVAHCDKFIFDQTPSHVKIGDLNIHSNSPQAQIIRIEKFIKHPNYNPGFLNNDIALAKLVTDVKIGPNALPACLVNNDLTMPFYEMGGLGPYNLNNFLRDDEVASLNNSLVLTRMRVDPIPCHRTNSSEFICAKNSKFLVPDTCRVEHGGGLERETWHYDRYFQYVFGLGVAGNDCGFGSKAYFVRTAAHSQWIESIVLGVQKPAAVVSRPVRQIVFPSEDNSFYSSVGQECRTAQNTAGKCQYYKKCPNVILQNMVKICLHGSDPIVCCETPTKQTYKIKKCVTYWKQYKQREVEEYEGIPSEGRTVQREEYPHIAFVGIRRNSEISWSCTAVIVSDRFVLSSASCVKLGSQNVVRMGTVELASSVRSAGIQDIEIERIVTHPNFNVAGLRADLALIRLASNIKFDSKTLPACLWPNTEAVPLKLYSLGMGESQLIVRPRLTKYNQDCRKFYQLRNLLDKEYLCAENYYISNDSCQDRNGDPIEGIVTTGNIKISIVVGITAYPSGCPGKGSDTATVYTRLSAYMDWIRNVVES
ncbi:transmembrane protease serine 9-like [Sabethes cyaneus]|uniref:transmembrane protease serine 9-like n=1 Tax=Sabethes cyaneus TaxID=53552 RepID=UPI00237D44C9|nr:transmembrane protease serine 9-like [Sabethes cyaneus]